MSPTPRRRPALSSDSRRIRPPWFLRSAPRRRVRAVASADVDGLTGPITGTTAQHRPRRRPSAPTVLLTAIVVALCVGCGSPAPFPREKTIDPQAELAARPTLEEMTARYDGMLQRIRNRLDSELGPFSWHEADPPSWGTCGPRFPFQLGGRTTTSPIWMFTGNIPDDQWPHARRIVADITAEYGFVTAGVQVDTPATPGKPGHHVTGGVDATLDAHYNLTTHVNTVLRVHTGCHLATNPTGVA
jgi:hypothetical protein